MAGAAEANALAEGALDARGAGLFGSFAIDESMFAGVVDVAAVVVAVSADAAASAAEEGAATTFVDVTTTGLSGRVVGAGPSARCTNSTLKSAAPIAPAATNSHP